MSNNFPPELVTEYSIEIPTGHTGVPRIFMLHENLDHAMDATFKALDNIAHRIGDGPFRIIVDNGERRVSGTIQASSRSCVWDDVFNAEPLPIRPVEHAVAPWKGQAAA